MKKHINSMKSWHQNFQKNIKALKQANITPSQIPNLMKEFDIWWKIIVNLRDIEGSWTKAMKRFMKMFEGVPRRNIRQTDDHPPDGNSSAQSPQ